MSISRRAFVQLTGATLSGASAGPQSATPPPLVIDSHAHLYSADEVRYPPKSYPTRPPAGAGTLDRLQHEVKLNHVRGVCAVQVSGFYGFDNRLICEAAKANPGWMAGVCTLDPDDTRSPALLAQYRKEYGIRGLRSVPSRGRRLDCLEVRALWKSALDQHVVINLMIHGDLADEACRLL